MEKKKIEKMFAKAMCSYDMILAKEKELFKALCAYYDEVDRIFADNEEIPTENTRIRYQKIGEDIYVFGIINTELFNVIETDTSTGAIKNRNREYNETLALTNISKFNYEIVAKNISLNDIEIDLTWDSNKTIVFRNGECSFSL